MAEFAIKDQGAEVQTKKEMDLNSWLIVVSNSNGRSISLSWWTGNDTKAERSSQRRDKMSNFGVNR